MKRALLHAADLASLALAVPAACTVLLCSWRSGGSGVGHHSAAFGCLAASQPEEAAAGAGVTVTTGAGGGGAGVTVTTGAGGGGAGVTVTTACEAALLAAFCCLQAARLLASAAGLLTNSATRLRLHALTASLLLVATASAAINNPSSFLYGAGFALQFLALTAQLSGLGLAVAVFVEDGVHADGEGEGVGGGQPVSEGSFRRLPTPDRRLPFADDEDRLVYEFRGDGRLEWRLGEDRGGGGGGGGVGDWRHATA